MSLTDEQIDRALSTVIPGGSQARDWFLPHESDRGLQNVRQVVRLMIESAATAPLLSRIKELERELEVLRKDADRWAMLREESKRVDPVCALLWKKNSDRSSNRWVNVVDYDEQVDAAKEHP